MVVTVPAHRWLWSDADVFLGHVKRYTRRDIRRELDAAGLRVVHCAHVFSYLAPPVLVRRRLRTSRAPELGLDVDSPAIDRVATVLHAVEQRVAAVAPLPFGTSIIAVATPA